MLWNSICYVLAYLNINWGLAWWCLPPAQQCAACTLWCWCPDRTQRRCLLDLTANEAEAASCLPGSGQVRVVTPGGSLDHPLERGVHWAQNRQRIHLMLRKSSLTWLSNEISCDWRAVEEKMMMTGDRGGKTWMIMKCTLDLSETLWGVSFTRIGAGAGVIRMSADASLDERVKPGSYFFCLLGWCLPQPWQREAPTAPPQNLKLA